MMCKLYCGAEKIKKIQIQNLMNTPFKQISATLSLTILKLRNTQSAQKNQETTVCPRRLHLIYIVTYYIKWVKYFI